MREVFYPLDKTAVWDGGAALLGRDTVRSPRRPGSCESAIPTRVELGHFCNSIPKRASSAAPSKMIRATMSDWRTAG
jgi:hypothetical protein